MLLDPDRDAAERLTTIRIKYRIVYNRIEHPVLLLPYFKIFIYILDKSLFLLYDVNPNLPLI